MNTSVVVAALTVLVVACQSATTTNMPGSTHVSHSTHAHHSHASHRPHSTKEPNVAASFSFFYLSTTHNVIIRNGHDCYIATLTADELNKVHTDMGMKTIELRLLGQLSAATNTTSATLHAAEVKHCGKNINNFYTMA